MKQIPGNSDRYRPSRSRARSARSAITLAALLAGTLAYAQMPVDDQGQPVATDTSAIGPADIENPRLPASSEYGTAELEALVGPIALYPDDLLAVVLPAATYPLEVVQAARFLEQLSVDPSLQPDDEWDDSIVALLNYPDVVELMNDDLDWTWQLGDAVVRQQTDVVLAIETFRDRAFAAGNLESDQHQTISRGDAGAIEIQPANDDVIYVPYYEPERVVYASTAPVYHYYPHAYPVYYYPYPASYRFPGRVFWGVTTAYSIGWSSNYLHVYHQSYRGHPYYGYNYSYGSGYWRRPSISVHNNWYVNKTSPQYRYRHYRGDYWRPRQHRSGARPSTRVVSQRSNPRSVNQSFSNQRSVNRGGSNRTRQQDMVARRNGETNAGNAGGRNSRSISNDRNRSMPGRVASRGDSIRGDSIRGDDAIRFRTRPDLNATTTNRRENRTGSASTSIRSVDRSQPAAQSTRRRTGGGAPVSRTPRQQPAAATGSRRDVSSMSTSSRRSRVSQPATRPSSRGSSRGATNAASSPRGGRPAAAPSRSRPSSASSGRSSGRASKPRSSGRSSAGQRSRSRTTSRRSS